MTRPATRGSTYPLHLLGSDYPAPIAFFQQFNEGSDGRVVHIFNSDQQRFVDQFMMEMRNFQLSEASAMSTTGYIRHTGNFGYLSDTASNGAFRGER